MDLLDLPKHLRTRGFDSAELCHFHIPGVDRKRLEELRDSFEDAGVRIQSLLIDDGDLSSPENGDRDAEWIAKWVDAAAIIGAERARVIAGKSEFETHAFERSLGHLRKLANQAEAQNVRLTIENWFPLLSTPTAVNDMLDKLDGKVGLCADFGNWDAPRKYTDLSEILPRAETCHAKCEFLNPRTIDLADFGKCLDLCETAQFGGPFVLVNGGPGDEWNALELSRKAIEHRES
jgi:sugar phosphate isomerase/epimerase